MDNQAPAKKTWDRIINSTGFKIFSIFILVLLLMIPASMIRGLIHEREGRKASVINEITSKWGSAQTITGPVISIPYKKYFENTDGKRTYSTLYMHFLPDDLDVKGEISPEIRYRTIYEAVVYNSSLTLTGSFSPLEIEELGIPKENIIWSRAFICLGISDMRGIKEQIYAEINGENIPMNPGIETNDVISSGISAKIFTEDTPKSYSFKFDLSLKGSQEISFIPVGKMNTVTLSSDWPDPSFDGAYLPMERTITEKGFTAKWKIIHLNRNYPQYWNSSSHKVDSSAFGVKLFIPADIYQKSMRTAKYALMFIVLTFMAFFFSEIMNKTRVHPIQYLFIGLAIIIFYSLLISISEHTNFDFAYIISSIAIIIMISGYAKSILKNKYITGIVAGILFILYAYLYLLLQLEDYALLMGSIGLFIVLGLVMYLTRKIDWYSIRVEE